MFSPLSVWHVQEVVVTVCMQGTKLRHQQCDRDGFRNRMTLTFDLSTSGSAPAEHLSWEKRADFNVDSSSRFPFRAWNTSV